METPLQSTNQELLTRKEVADRLRISLTTLNKLITTQKLSSVHIGRRKLITEKQLNTFTNKGGSK
jgi:excisionase family DNA binding protein